MASAGCLRRLEFALAAFGLTAALGALLVGLDAVRFHTAALAAALLQLELGAVDPAGVALLVLAGAEAAIVLAAARSILIQVRGQRRFLRKVPIVGRHTIASQPVTIIGGSDPLAFCAGFLRPRVYLSLAALRLLDEDELRAVLAHERHHATRRDPLRLLIAGALASAFGMLPGLRTLRERHAALAEIAADAAAVRSLGDPAPLASALLAFEGSSSPAVVGIAPERVDHLLGEARSTDIAPWLMLLIGGVLAILALVVMRFALWPGHPELSPAAPLCTLVAIACLVVLTGPAWFASRQVTRTLQPAS